MDAEPETNRPSRRSRGARRRPDPPPPYVERIRPRSGLSRATFYERFEGMEDCFADAYEDGVERLTAAIEGVAQREGAWANQVSAGLCASLGFLAADPSLAHLLLVEALAASRPARLEHERSLERLADVLRPPVVGGVEEVSEEAARMLAGGLASRLSGCILAGEAEQLPELHDTMLRFLLAPARLTTASARRHAAQG